MATEKLANNAGSTLSGSITNSAGTLVVASAAGFPSTPQFRILIESEILLVTGVSGTTFTVARGQDGTSPASHASGKNVDHILTRDALKIFRSDMIPAGDYADRPTPEIDGRLYFIDDGRHVNRDYQGGAWQAYGPVNRMYPISSALYSQFAWPNSLNVGTSSWSAGCMMIKKTTSYNGYDNCEFLVALSEFGVTYTDDWQLTAHIWGYGEHYNYAKWGLCGWALQQGTTPPLDQYLAHSNTWGISLINAGGWNWINEKWKQGGLYHPFGTAGYEMFFDSNQSTPFAPLAMGVTAYWSRVSYISNNYVWEISLDGIFWFPMTTYDDSWAVISEVGIFVSPLNDLTTICCCDSFNVIQL